MTQTHNPIDPSSRNELLELQKDLQSLRLELSERDEALSQSREEIERLHFQQAEQVKVQVAAELEALFADLSAPIAQSLTQAYLLEQAQKPIQAKDVLAVTRRIIRSLQERGMEIEGDLGEIVPFDPDRHLAINGADIPSGAPGRIRLVGIRFHGKILRKAMVEKVEF